MYHVGLLNGLCSARFYLVFFSIRRCVFTKCVFYWANSLAFIGGYLLLIHGVVLFLVFSDEDAAVQNIDETVFDDTGRDCQIR